MSGFPAFQRLLIGLSLAWMLSSKPVLACAACFGKSDSPLAQGMNMGILVLLGFITTVLAAVAGFFLYLGRRGATLAARSSAAGIAQTNIRSQT
jgi:hypothetical protein